MGQGQTGRRRGDNGGRHRLAAGSMRLVSDASGQWSLMPVARPTQYVGRVGALAVLLGVGAAITGLPAVAAADTGSGADTTVATDATDSSPAPAPRRPSRGARTDSADSPATPSTDPSDNGRPRRGATNPGATNPGSTNPGSTNPGSTNPGSAASTAPGRRGNSPKTAPAISGPDTSVPRASTDSVVASQVSAAVDTAPAAPEIVEAAQEIAPAASTSAPGSRSGRNGTTSTGHLR
jgi:endoglycosylceramidase